MADRYKIVRGYFNYQKYGKRTIKTGLTLEEARLHCLDPETSSRTARGSDARKRTRERGAWFDGYEKE